MKRRVALAVLACLSVHQPLASEEIVRADWLYTPHPNFEQGGFEADYFDSDGNLVLHVRKEGPINHMTRSGLSEHGADTVLGYFGIQYEGRPGPWAGNFRALESLEVWLSGAVRVDKAGCYEWWLGADDYAELWFEGKPPSVWDNPWAAGATPLTRISMQVNRTYKVNIVFKNRKGSGALSFHVKQSRDCPKEVASASIKASDIEKSLKKGIPVTIYGGEVVGVLNLVNVAGKEKKLATPLVIRDSTIKERVIAGLRGEEPVTFSETVDFGGTHFLQGAAFENARFEKAATFKGAIFEQGVSFTRGDFQQGADFAYGTFLRDTEFVGTRFAEKVDFRRAKWLNSPAYFTSAEFHGQTTFSGARFFLPAVFDGALFAEATTFSGVTFTRGLILNGGTARGRFNLHVAPASGLVDFAGFTVSPANFNFDWFQIQPHLGENPDLHILRLMEDSLRTRERPWEANQVAAARYDQELRSQAPGWFQLAVWLLVKIPSNYGTDAVRLMLLVMLTYLPFRWVLRNHWETSDCHYRREPTLGGVRLFLVQSCVVVFKAWKWILISNVVLILSGLLLTESIPIYKLLSPTMVK